MTEGAKTSRVVQYFKEVRAEIRKVAWPSREEVMRLSAIVLLVLVVSSIFMALVDYGFSWIIQQILQLGQ